MDDAARADGEQLEQRSRRAGGGERHRLRLGDAGQHGQRVHRSTRARRPRPRLLRARAGRRRRVRRLRLLRAHRPPPGRPAPQRCDRRSVPSWPTSPTARAGGVQYLDVVAGGAVWVSEPAGQGLDATLHHLRRRHAPHARDLQGSVTSTVVDSAASARSCSSRPAATRPVRRRRRPHRRRASSSHPAGRGQPIPLVSVRPSPCSAPARRSSPPTPRAASST